VTEMTGTKAIWSAVAEASWPGTVARNEPLVLGYEPTTPLSHWAVCPAVGEARRRKRDAGMDTVVTLGLSKSGVAGLRPLPPHSKLGMKTNLEL